MRPQIAITLGSGLSQLVDEMEVDASISFAKIPHFPQPSVTGHRGTMTIGYLNEIPLLVMQGRVHYYEGYSMQDVVYPTRCLGFLGIKTLILSNASGGLTPEIKPGQIMLIKDHINLTGNNPLIGPNLDELGPRFPDMSEPYNRKLNALAKKIMEEESIAYTEGVYCGILGPSYETASEVQFMQKIGGHAVGMSTVSETIAAVHIGLKVCGISCITNLTTGLTTKILTHEDVKKTAQLMEKDFCLLINKLIPQIP